VTSVALDTSAAVPYLMSSHHAHGTTRRHLDGRQPVLTEHSLAECYSVITRLPGDARVTPADAVELIDANFGTTALLDPAEAGALHRVLAPLGVAGGAVYDALVGLAARSNGLPLATRDLRAAATYAAIGVAIDMIEEPRDP